MQAEDGLSLDAQRAAITAYCTAHGFHLIRIYTDVESGAKSDRRGLEAALAARADVFVVLKFDRLSRSIKHFCQLYEDYFSQSMELVAIREAIKLDSALGRALVGILLVFAQMEREAIGERTREAIRHIRSGGYHYGTIPYGKKAMPAPDNPRYRVLVDREDELRFLARVRELIETGEGSSRVADILNEEKVPPPRGAKWTRGSIYQIKCRLGWHTPKPNNERNHTDEDVKVRMAELRAKGHTYQAIANILNEEG
jgi:DNA invertase Pin-like site-specific DNA recombinase